MAKATAPQLVQLDSTSTPDDMLQIHYRGAELKLPAGVGMDAVATLLRSIQGSMIDLSKVHNYYVACGYTDLRLGIDGLAAVVTQQFGSQLDEKRLFLSCGHRADRIKALYWSGDRYILLYKRLSNGRFQWPRSEAELRLLDLQSFCWLMEGLKVE